LTYVQDFHGNGGHFENSKTSFLFSKWPPTKAAKFQCSLISMKIDIKGYFEVRNGLVMMKIAFRVIFTMPPFPKPRYQFSLKSENIEILPILLAAILKIKMTLNAIFIIINQFLTSK
jgi:hypothetical protein